MVHRQHGDRNTLDALINAEMVTVRQRCAACCMPTCFVRFLGLIHLAMVADSNFVVQSPFGLLHLPVQARRCSKPRCPRVPRGQSAPRRATAARPQLGPRSASRHVWPADPVYAGQPRPNGGPAVAAWPSRPRLRTCSPQRGADRPRDNRGQRSFEPRPTQRGGADRTGSARRTRSATMFEVKMDMPHKPNEIKASSFESSNSRPPFPEE